MDRQLRIGDVATLVGVSTKTIRYYHEIGLLEEPVRSGNGYRLYGASDLLRLHRIRHLQGLGLSLQQIRRHLSASDQEQSLRRVLEGLLSDLDAQLDTLQARRARIARLLAEETPDEMNDPTVRSTFFERMEKHLGPLLAEVDPALLAQERRLWSLIEAFNWPDSHQAQLQALATTLLETVAAAPGGAQPLQTLGDTMARLATLAEDDSQVEALARAFSESGAAGWLRSISAAQPSPDGAWGIIMGEVLASQLSPAQRRFLALVEQDVTRAVKIGDEDER